MFNTNLIEFLTGSVDGQFKPGADGSSVLTLPELLGVGPGGFGGNFGAGRGPLTTEVMNNVKRNAIPMAIGVIGIPIAANVLMKVIRKPVILPANRMLKSVGLDVKL